MKTDLMPQNSFGEQLMETHAADAVPQEFAFILPTDAEALDDLQPDFFETPTEKLNKNFLDEVESQAVFFIEQPPPPSSPVPKSTEPDSSEKSRAHLENFWKKVAAMEKENQVSVELKDASDSVEKPGANSQVAEPKAPEVFGFDYENYVLRPELSPTTFVSEKTPAENAFGGNQSFDVPTVSADENQALYLSENSAVAEQSVFAALEIQEIPSLDYQNTESVILKTFSQDESCVCPFCRAENAAPALVCTSCCAMLSLADLERLLSYREANAKILETAIKSLEAEKSARPQDAAQLTNLAIAYLNLNNLRQAFAPLQAASQMNPDDTELASKVNFLAIRLAEIEAEENKLPETEIKSLVIMIVDDNAAVRGLVSSELEKCGYTVTSAVDGSDALSKIKDATPKLILLNVMLPQMDGYEVCRLIRCNELTKEVPVVMISGKEGPFDKIRGRKVGSTAYISKPFGPETLLRTIETCLV